MASEAPSRTKVVVRRWAWRPVLLQALPVAIYVLTAAARVWYGNINADEGWILNAARQAMRGLLPHRDFAYTQGPLQPYVYGLLLWPFGFSVLSGRVLTALLGLGALVLAMRLAGHLSRSAAGATLAGLFVALNLDATYHNTIAKTHALVALLLMLAVYLAVCRAARGPGWTLLTLLVALLAVATRLTAVAVFVLLLAQLWRQGADRRALVAAVALALVVGVVWGIIVGADRLWFDLVRYHTPDPQAVYAPSTWLGHLEEAALTLCLACWYYAAVLLPLSAAVVLAWRNPDARELLKGRDEKLSGAWLAAAAGGLLFLAHLPGRGFGVLYMSMSLPLMACGSAVVVLRLGEWAKERGRGMRSMLGVCLAVLLLFAGAFPSLETARITCSLSAPDLPALRQVAKYVRALAPPERTLLTFHTYLAAEAGLPVPPRYSMSVFAYQPTLTTEQCTRLGVVNDALLAQDLSDPQVGVVALTARDVQMLRSPRQALEVLRQRWQRVRTVARFGQWHDEMAILVPQAGTIRR